MRKEFADSVFTFMKKDKRIYVLTGDLGFGVWDKIRDEFPDRFFNVGSSEVSLLGISVGLAQDKKIPLAYSITPFLLYRPAEVIRNYLDHESCTVKLIGAGRERDYGHLGFTHWADDAKSFLNNFPNIKQYFPKHMNPQIVEEILYNGKPSFVSLKR